MMPTDTRPVTERIMALSERDCRAALLILAGDRAASVSEVLDRIAASHSE